MPETSRSTPIVSTRLLDAPQELVFSTFRDPVILASWWGPDGATNDFSEFDFRPGGAWRFVMRMPDGTSYPMDKEFLEIREPERIVILHKQAGHDFVQTISIAEEAGKARLTWEMQFDSEEEARNVRSIIQEKNEENFDRLEAALAGMRA